MTADILIELAEAAKRRTEEAKASVSLRDIREISQSMRCDTGFPFEKAIAESEDIAFICECKRASPSKGIIAEHYPYLEIAKDYETAGATCISCLTEPTRFLGSNAHLKEIADIVSIPVIRKDFVVDEYMIHEAKILGASAVLLIMSILTDEQVTDYIRIADHLGLSCLVETHDAEEIGRAVRCGARMIGVNNRNLRDFSVDTGNSSELASSIPENVLFVAESGISCAEDVEAMRRIGADAVLVGETLMRAPDKKIRLAELRSVA